MIKKAVIPAAGFGTRFLPATKALPKEMLPIVDKPNLQYIIEEAIASGIEDIIIVTGRNKKSMEDHFDKSIELELLLKKTGKLELLETVENISNLVDIHYMRQKEPLGLGHAILCTKKFIGNEPFAVLLPDDIIDAEVPALKQMMGKYEEVQSSILGVNEVPNEDVHKYGIVDYSEAENNLFSVKKLVEKPSIQNAPSNQAIVGRYILTPGIFDELEKVQPDSKGEIQLTDAIDSLLMKESIYSYIFEGKRYDVGDKFGFLQATFDFALKRDDLREPLLAYLKNKLRE
jgi:UTP--glucose-1-phosphate uridylyltransferase